MNQVPFRRVVPPLEPVSGPHCPVPPSPVYGLKKQIMLDKTGHGDHGHEIRGLVVVHDGMTALVCIDDVPGTIISEFER